MHVLHNTPSMHVLIKTVGKCSRTFHGVDKEYAYFSGVNGHFRFKINSLGDSYSTVAQACNNYYAKAKKERPEKWPPQEDLMTLCRS
jgi:hypothetical protein